jgi:cell division protease FtsH
MGGRVAEQLMLNDVTSGAAMDIRQATEIVKKMVCQWGMSDALGPLSFTGREEHIFLGRDITRSEDHSDDTAQTIDAEIRRLVLDAETRARTLLTENRERLTLLGKALLERETMNAAEIRELLGFPPEAKAEATTASTAAAGTGVNPDVPASITPVS